MIKSFNVNTFYGHVIENIKKNTGTTFFSCEIEKINQLPRNKTGVLEVNVNKAKSEL